MNYAQGTKLWMFMDVNTEDCAQEDEIIYFSDPYNLISLTVSFLSRSTQESGLSHKEKKTKNQSQEGKSEVKNL